MRRSARSLACALALIAAAQGSTADDSQGDPQLDYMLQCQGCHLASGEAVPSADVPSLIDLAPRFLGSAEGRAYLLRVPGVAQAPLSDAAVARLMNWVLTRFRSSDRAAGFEPFSEREVARARARGPMDVVATRARLLEARPEPER